jgi:hypothetical protein
MIKNYLYINIILIIISFCLSYENNANIGIPQSNNDNINDVNNISVPYYLNNVTNNTVYRNSSFKNIVEHFIYNETDILPSKIYSPTVTTLENQIKLKNLLQTFHKFLEIRHIPHSLIFGSLLSAVRNKILMLPWDDDLDMVIPQYLRYKMTDNNLTIVTKRNGNIKDVLVSGLQRRYNFDFYNKTNRYCYSYLYIIYEILYIMYLSNLSLHLSIYLFTNQVDYVRRINLRELNVNIIY